MRIRNPFSGGGLPFIGSVWPRRTSPVAGSAPPPRARPGAHAGPPLRNAAAPDSRPLPRQAPPVRPQARALPPSINDRGRRLMLSFRPAELDRMSHQQLAQVAEYLHDGPALDLRAIPLGHNWSLLREKLSEADLERALRTRTAEVLAILLKPAPLPALDARTMSPHELIEALKQRGFDTAKIREMADAMRALYATSASRDGPQGVNLREAFEARYAGVLVDAASPRSETARLFHRVRMLLRSAGP